MRQAWKPGTMIYPIPAVLVSCGTWEKSNFLTVAWTGTINSDPAMCFISIRPCRYSYDLIREQMEFTVNLTTTKMARATDWAGVKSGRDFNKWKETGLTPEKGVMVGCPYIKESPIAIECRVREIMSLGTHDMFIGEVLNVLADEKYLDVTTGRFDLERSEPLVFSHGGYYNMGTFIGKFGFSVQKNNKNK